LTELLYFVTQKDPTSVNLALGHKNVDVGICLLQDAVYLGVQCQKDGKLDAAVKRGIPIYAAKNDVKLRGLDNLINQEIKLLDYNEIVDLVIKYNRIINI
jgi:sulfur relay protein TusB/DsrH